MTVAAHHHCIVCDRPLESSMDECDAASDSVARYPATHFQAYGNYGSTLFDPSAIASESHIEVVICDWCLIEKAQRVRLFLKNGQTTPFPEYTIGCVRPGERPSSQT